MNAKFDLDILFLEPGEEIFIPSAMWLKHPQRDLAYPLQERLKTTLAYTRLQLTRQKSLEHTNACNGSKDYVYGGNVL